MCASFLFNASKPEQVLVKFQTDLDLSAYSGVLIVPHRKAPVIIANNPKPKITEMRFSLLPHWSKEPKVKFATHNARLETIDEKPTWKTVFLNNHCLVPLTDFIEPIYSGEFAGNMVAFSKSSGDVMYAAGVFDEWVNKETGEIIPSFSIITYDPPPFVADTGHDRCPVFLTEDDGIAWINNAGGKAKDLKEFLFENRITPELSASKFRAMKPGWEKRK